MIPIHQQHCSSVEILCAEDTVCDSSLQFSFPKDFTYHSNHILKAPHIRLYMHCLFIDIFSPCLLLRETFTYLLLWWLLALPSCVTVIIWVQMGLGNVAQLQSASVTWAHTSLIPPLAPEQEGNRHCSVVTVVSTSKHPGMLLLILAIFNYTFPITFFSSSFIDHCLVTHSKIFITDFLHLSAEKQSQSWLVSLLASPGGLGNQRAAWCSERLLF